MLFLCLLSYNPIWLTLIAKRNNCNKTSQVLFVFAPSTSELIHSKHNCWRHPPIMILCRTRQLNLVGLTTRVNPESKSLRTKSIVYSWVMLPLHIFTQKDMTERIIDDSCDHYIYIYIYQSISHVSDWNVIVGLI